MKPMLQILHSLVIPWLADNEERLIVARPSMTETPLPKGATLSPREIKGKRVIVKGERNLANQRLIMARWPKANLHEIALPKLACVVNGQADYLFGEYSVRCDKGTFILIPPGMAHQRTGPFLDGDNLVHGYCTTLFTFAYSHGILLWFCNSRGTQHVNAKVNNYLIPNMAAVQIFRLMMAEAVAGANGFAPVCNGLLSAFFSLLAREITAGHYTLSGPRKHLEDQTHSKTNFARQLHEYIELNFTRQLKISEIAAQMYLSTPHFCRRVRQETGTTFGELLTRYRIERAQELLLETDWTVIAVAKHVGFRSVSHFQELFRHRVGQTPIEYRHKKTIKSQSR